MTAAERRTLKNVECGNVLGCQRSILSATSKLPGTPPKNVALSQDRLWRSAQAGETIANFSATDVEGKALEFSLASDAGGLFEIVGTR